MPTYLNQDAWEDLVDGDLEWLMRQPRTLERDHIVICLEWLRENKPPAPNRLKPTEPKDTI